MRLSVLATNYWDLFIRNYENISILAFLNGKRGQFVRTKAVRVLKPHPLPKKEEK